MSAIQTTVHVGADGIPRLAIPVEERNRDVTVTITVNHVSNASDVQANGLADIAQRQRLSEAGIRIPAPGSWNGRNVPPLLLDGPPVSETLVEDRR